MIKVSVIVPVYNMEKYLPKCLDSLVNQTLEEIEIIVIDNNSTDSSLKILETYAKKHKNIVVLKNNVLGIGRTRNMGLEVSKGEFLAFLDSDDFIELNAYERMYSEAKKYNLDILISNYYKFYENRIDREIIVYDHFDRTCIKDMPELVFRLEYGPANKLFKRSMVINNNISFEESLKYEDMPFVAKSILKANSIGHIEEAYLNYRIRSGSETKTVDEKCFDILKILKIVNNYYFKNDFKNMELEYLNILKATDYIVQQRNQLNKKIRKKFVLESYEFLNTNFPNWKNNKYYKKTNFLKRLVKNNRFFLNIYFLFKG